MSKECNACMNSGTPICETCVVVETAKGDRPPSMYCGYDIKTADEILKEDLAAMIKSRAKNGRPIPIRYVIKYNKLLEVSQNGKKKDLPAS